MLVHVSIQSLRCKSESLTCLDVFFNGCCVHKAKMSSVKQVTIGEESLTFKASSRFFIFISIIFTSHSSLKRTILILGPLDASGAEFLSNCLFRSFIWMFQTQCSYFCWLYARQIVASKYNSNISSFNGQMVVPFCAINWPSAYIKSQYYVYVNLGISMKLQYLKIITQIHYVNSRPC